MSYLRKKKVFLTFPAVMLLSLLFMCGCSKTKNDNLPYGTNSKKSLILFKKGSAEQYYITAEEKDKIFTQGLNQQQKEISKSDIDIVLDGYPEKNFLNVVFNRTSCRNFKDGPDIPDKDIEIMLRAAMASPTGFDLRSWSFIVIKDKKTIKEIFKFMLIDEERYDEEQYFEHVKVLIIVCADPSIAKGYFFDSGLSSLNLWLAAEYMNYAAGWTDISPHQSRIAFVKEKLKITNTVIPMNIIAVGYYGEDKLPKNKFNESKIHNEFWNNPDKFKTSQTQKIDFKRQ